MARRYILTEEEAALAFAQIRSHCQAIQNWLVSAVERKDYDYADTLSKDYRTHQRLFAKLNVEAHKTIDAANPRIARENADDRELAFYIERVGEFCGQENYVKFLSNMQSVVVDFRAGRDAEELAKEIVEYG